MNNLDFLKAINIWKLITLISKLFFHKKGLFNQLRLFHTKILLPHDSLRFFEIYYHFLLIVKINIHFFKEFLWLRVWEFYLETFHYVSFSFVKHSHFKWNSFANCSNLFHFESEFSFCCNNQHRVNGLTTSIFYLFCGTSHFVLPSISI